MTEVVPNLENPEGFEQVPELIRMGDIPAEKMPFDIALIIDGIVYTIFNVDGQGAAQLLAQPTFARVLDDSVRPGYLYSDGTFTPA